MFFASFLLISCAIFPLPWGHVTLASNRKTTKLNHFFIKLYGFRDESKVNRDQPLSVLIFAHWHLLIFVASLLVICTQFTHFFRTFCTSLQFLKFINLGCQFFQIFLQNLNNSIAFFLPSSTPTAQTGSTFTSIKRQKEAQQKHIKDGKFLNS